jgi:hypothetical protein
VRLHQHVGVFVGRRRDANHRACGGPPRLRSLLSCRNDRGAV